MAENEFENKKSNLIPKITIIFILLAAVITVWLIKNNFTVTEDIP